MLHSDKETIVISVFVGLLMIVMFSIPFFVVNKYQKKHNVVHTYDTIIDSGVEYVIKDSISARLESLKKTSSKFVVPESILFNGRLVPVDEVSNCAFMEIFYDKCFLDNIIAYESKVDIPMDFECRNIQYVTSKVSGYDLCMCPSFCDFRNLKVLKLYGNGIFSYGDGYNDTCKKFVQGCENLEIVILSGFESICIFDGFNYCVNLKTLILENVGRIHIEDGFRVTSKLNYICIVGDTIGKDIEIIGTGKKIIYKNN